MTEDQIQKLYDRDMDKLDAQLHRGEIGQKTYQKKVRDLELYVDSLQAGAED